MNLVYLDETIMQKRLILPGIGKLSKVALYDLYVREYNSSKLGGAGGTHYVRAKSFVSHHFN